MLSFSTPSQREGAAPSLQSFLGWCLCASTLQHMGSSGNWGGFGFCCAFRECVTPYTIYGGTCSSNRNNVGEIQYPWRNDWCVLLVSVSPTEKISLIPHLAFPLCFSCRKDDASTWSYWWPCTGAQRRCPWLWQPCCPLSSSPSWASSRLTKSARSIF